MPRRILTGLRLDKIAVVDRPCQEHASADIMKRDWTQGERDAAAKAGEAMPGGEYPIKTVGDLRDAIQAIGRAKDPAATKAHIISRAKALGATDQLPEDWSNKEAKMLKELAKALGLPETATEGDVAKAVSENIAKGATLASQVAALSIVAKMSDKHKAHMDNLPNQDAKDKFAAMSADDRDAACAKSSPDIEKALRDGEAFRTPEGVMVAKAKVGDELFGVLKASNNARVAMAADLAKAKEKDEVADFAKRAEGVGMEPEFGATMRKAYTGDAAAQALLEKRFKALTAQVDAGELFKSFGNGSTEAAGAEAEFMAKVEEVKKADPKLSDQQAYARAYNNRGNRDIVKRMNAEAAAA